MPAYRLVHARHAASAFDGEGARRYGGRWNSKGKRTVYVAQSEALALLEVLVHLGNAWALSRYRLFRIELPAEHVQPLDRQALPANWREDPAPAATAAIGDAWLGGDALALAVPSTIAVRDHSYLLNPQHPAFAAVVAAAEPLALAIDRRLPGLG